MRLVTNHIDFPLLQLQCDHIISELSSAAYGLADRCLTAMAECIQDRTTHRIA